jgi:hypothetical protein
MKLRRHTHPMLFLAAAVAAGHAATAPALEEFAGSPRYQATERMTPDRPFGCSELSFRSEL